MSRFSTYLWILIVFPIFLTADDVGAESKRTVVMDVDKESSAELNKFVKLDEAEQNRFLVKLVRKGTNSLVTLPETNGILLRNARDIALAEIAQWPVSEDDRADRALLRAGEDPERLHKIIERYPMSTASTKALRLLVAKGHGASVISSWEPLLQRKDLRDLKLPKKAKKTIVFPASENHPDTKIFPSTVTGDLILRGSIFQRRRPQLNAHGDVHEMPRFPQSYLGYVGDGIVLGDYRGLIRFKMGDKLQSHLYESSPALLGHLDNNIIGDVTIVGNRALTSQRSTPQKRDSQKNLYIVDLSRQKICSFKIDDGLKVHERFESTWKWTPDWILSDGAKTFNGSIVVRGNVGYCTSTYLSGLFNVDIIAFDINTGKIIWKRTIASGQQELNYFGRHIREALAGTPLVTDNRIYVSSNAGTIHCLDLSGRPMWVRRYERVATPVPIQYYAHVHPRLSRWRNQMPRIVDGRLFCAPTDSDALICLDPKNGRLQWNHNLNPKRRGRSYPHDEYWRKAYWYAGKDGVFLYDKYKISKLASVTGKVMSSRIVNHRTHYVGRPLVCRDSFVIATMNSLVFIDRKTLKASRTVDLHKLGIRFKHANIFWNGDYLTFIDIDGNLFVMRLGVDS